MKQLFYYALVRYDMKYYLQSKKGQGQMVAYLEEDYQVLIVKGLLRKSQEEPEYI